MSKLLTTIIFFDVELTCWESKETTPENFVPEIIQIGICEFNTFDKKISREKSFLVKPENELSEFCKTLTGLTDKKLSRANDLKTVCDNISRLYSKHKTWMSWGKDNLLMKNGCESKGVDSPIPESNFVDFSIMYSMLHGLVKQPSLIKSMEKNNIVFEGDEHDAMYDAINTARLFSALMGKLK